MAKVQLFNKGDVILTNPEEGFWGIAIVLSEAEKTKESYARCHIAITPIISQEIIDFNQINIESLKPIEFERFYTFEKQKRKPKPFSKIETCIGVYTRRNKANLKIIGKIEPKMVYDGPLPFVPLYNLEIKWPVYGDSDKSLGSEALINWKRKNNTQ
ncbi:MAG TPA: hypothetical protein VGB63_16245 [Pedobacter sp.]